MWVSEDSPARVEAADRCGSSYTDSLFLLPFRMRFMARAVVARSLSVASAREGVGFETDHGRPSKSQPLTVEFLSQIKLFTPCFGLSEEGLA
ncbi:hypothetical protein EVAR_37423_1 [Eumeta japonica]|uniref:Uncharacterized protein n=1 Tax=Eumeta variegata TaxID=151549 RepID=A0A4C1WES9_EUMVA|nr:hypothetical protein EVAR_37423_1 [Eumeta japonica]